MVSHRLVVAIGFNPRTREGANASHHRADAQAVGFNPRTREGANLACRRPSP